jgi:hemolysin D
MLQERSRAFEQLLEKKYVSRLQYLQLEEDRINKQQQLAALKQQLAQDRAALAEAKQNHQAIQSEFKKARQAELAVIETKAASLSQELIKAKTRTRLQKLVAPVDGVVQQLAVHTIGGVVTPAQQLMVLVPKEEQIEVEAWVENKDIGFVNLGQTAEIKVEAFPFTRYGTIEGTITSLSKDAVPIEKVGLVYAARVAMAKTTIEVETKTVNLSPGMNVSVEIKTGQRRLIEFFLSPLLRGAKESLRER